MRYFLILLLGVIPFLSPAQVVISAKTARYFLEVDDSLQLYKHKESQYVLQVDSLKESLSQKDAIIVTYQQDSVTKVEEDIVQAGELAFERAQTKSAKKALRSTKIKTTLIMIGEGVLIVLLIL